MLRLVLLALLAEADQEAPKDTQPEEIGFHEVVVVTAAGEEQPLGDAVALVSTLTREDIARSPALVIDDHLRRVPGFSLLRRSSSIMAHPTTQGVSLRGIGPSGTSRSLVLWDGIPVNDPFGNWVYWNRFPTLSLEGMEVSRGATSQLYGSSALSGTVQFRPRAASEDLFDVRAQIGNRDTYDVNLLAADRMGDWNYLLSGRVFDTDGYIKVREEDRGDVDTPAGVQFQSFLGRAEYRDFHFTANLYNEERNNGTPLQNNDSSIYFFESGIDRENWSFNFYGQKGELNSRFSRIFPGRNREVQTANQMFPWTGFGSSFSMRTSMGLQWGVDWRRASWDENDQNFAGIFLQRLFTFDERWDLLAGLRADLWENSEIQGSFNPRVGINYRVSDEATLRSSVYRGFRAPSLNELYRPFRVGNVRTAANPDLQEEHLWGVEGGIDIHPSRALLLRLNGFWNSLQDPVANVTLEINDEGVFRQRQNLGSATIVGLEVEASYRLSQDWTAHAAYLFSDASVDETERRIPQVPKHSGNIGVNYDGPFQLTADLRFGSEQFEDDLNQFPLKAYGVVDFTFRMPVHPRAGIYFAVENVFDEDYEIARTPIPNLGTPRLVHGGVEIRLRR